MYFAPFYGYGLSTKQSLVLFIILDIFLIPFSIAVDLMIYNSIVKSFATHQSIDFILCNFAIASLCLGITAVAVVSVVETIKTLRDLVNEKRKDLKNEKQNQKNKFSRTKYIDDYVKSLYDSKK